MSKIYKAVPVVTFIFAIISLIIFFLTRFIYVPRILLIILLVIDVILQMLHMKYIIRYNL